MKQFEYVITDPVGLHARPTGLLVKRIKELSGEFVIECKGRSADLGKLLAVMGLGVRGGDRVVVRSENATDEEMTALKRFFEENL